MKVFVKNLLHRITLCLETTAIALIILSIIALIYDGTMICISTIFETLGVCILIQIIMWLFEMIDFRNLFVEIICRYTVVISLVISAGYMFHWIERLPIVVLGFMALVTYSLGYLIEMTRMKCEIAAINALTRKMN